MLDTIINTNPPITNDEKADYAFISYSHKDKDVVYDDLWALHEKGFSFWYDDGITAGNVWNETVDKVVNSPFCRLAIFFVSENSVISPAIRQEMELIKKLNKPFFTINISSLEVQDIIAAALARKEIRFSDISLLANFFDEDIIYVRRSEKDYINNVARHCMRHGLESKIEIVTVKHTTKKVLIICKNSSLRFSSKWNQSSHL